MKKYVLVGCGYRGISSYAKPIVKEYGAVAQLCGVYDINYKRAAYVSQCIEAEIPVFDSFDRMITEVRPDTVIVTSKDCTHDQYVIRAMELGCDVIVEKPITTDLDKARAIWEAQKRTGKNITTIFNLRYSPFFRRVKELVASGMLGDILSVHYEWMLDTRHGADYFRRWHRERGNSGSLLIHKSSHHFDIANWLLEQTPVAVNAFGTRRFYGPTREERSERCLTCPYATKCEFYKDITAETFTKELYLDCEDVDGYYRDRCVFSEQIDIEDSVSVNVRYSGGTVMSYSLTAHSPYEGLHLVLNGTKGRLEVQHISASSVAQGDYIRFYNRLGEKIEITPPDKGYAGHGGHDGADGLMLDRLMGVVTGGDPLGQHADWRTGFKAISIGCAANLSMAEQRQVSLEELWKEFDFTL